MTRRKTTRVYHVGTNRMLQIHKEWSMKYGQYLYRVTDYGNEAATLANVPSFAEARQFVRDFPREDAK